jgi:hypothetical protein
MGNQFNKSTVQGWAKSEAQPAVLLNFDRSAWNEYQRKREENKVKGNILDRLNKIEQQIRLIYEHFNIPN